MLSVLSALPPATMPQREADLGNPRQAFPMRFVFQSKELPYIGTVKSLDNGADVILDRQTEAVVKQLGYDQPQKMNLENPVNFKRYLKRMQRPTVSQLSRQRATLNEVIDVQNIGEYEWSCEGMKKFDDGMKQLYTVEGCTRKTPIWGRSKHNR